MSMLSILYVQNIAFDLLVPSNHDKTRVSLVCLNLQPDEDSAPSDGVLERCNLYQILFERLRVST